jgi:hypothetical protein
VTLSLNISRRNKINAENDSRKITPLSSGSTILAASNAYAEIKCAQLPIIVAEAGTRETNKK